MQALLSPSGAGCGAVRPPLWAMLLQLAQQKPKGREAVDAAAVLRCWRKAGAADPAEAAAALRVLLCLARRGALKDGGAAWRAALHATSVTRPRHIPQEGELEGELKGELLSRLQQPDCDTETAALLVQICCALGGDGWAEPLRHDPVLGGQGPRAGSIDASACDVAVGVRAPRRSTPPRYSSLTHTRSRLRPAT